MRKFLLAALSLTCAISVTACDSAKKELGLTKSAPDEFAVVKRAPLEMPPEFSLRPPSPGAPRPQEQATAEQARATLIGGSVPQIEGLTEGESELLNTANAASNPQIRAVVDQEAANAVRKNEPVVKKLLNIGSDRPPAATVVDPVGESERLRKNAQEGKPVTAGETPKIED